MGKFDRAIGNKSLKKAAAVNRSEANIPKIENISIDLLDENPDNDKVFNMDNEDILVRSIEENGFTGVVEVFKKPDGRYEISSGHRRVRAAKEAGKTSVPCIVNAMPDDVQRAKKLLDSNITNRTLGPMDYARMIDYYINYVWKPSGGKGQVDKACAEYFGISAGAVYKYRALLKMIPELMQLADKEQFPYTGFVSAHRLTEEDQKRLYSDLTAYSKEHTDENGEPGNVSRTYIMNAVTRLLKEEKIYIKDGGRKNGNGRDTGISGTSSKKNADHDVSEAEEQYSNANDDTKQCDPARGLPESDTAGNESSLAAAEMQSKDDGESSLKPEAQACRATSDNSTRIVNELASLKKQIRMIAEEIGSSSENDIMVQALSSVKDAIEEELQKLSG